MSTATVIDHLYVIDKKDDRVIVSFLASRKPWFTTAFAMIGVCFAPVWIGFDFGWNGSIMSALVGGSTGIALLIALR